MPFPFAVFLQRKSSFCVAFAAGEGPDIGNGNCGRAAVGGGDKGAAKTCGAGRRELLCADVVLCSVLCCRVAVRARSPAWSSLAASCQSLNDRILRESGYHLRIGAVAGFHLASLSACFSASLSAAFCASLSACFLLFSSSSSTILAESAADGGSFDPLRRGGEGVDSPSKRANRASISAGVGIADRAGQTC